MISHHRFNTHKALKLVALVSILLALPLTIYLTRQQQEVRQRAALPECTSSLQARIDAAAPGSTVFADRCIYREQITITKPIILDGGGGAYGEGGAEIRGSDVWSSWSQSGNTWVSTDSVPSLPAVNGIDFCRPGTNGRCYWPEQVFVDGQALFQLAAGSTPGPGEFALVSSSDRRVRIGTNPNGRLMEVTTRPAWVVTRANDVTIQGFVMKHAGAGSDGGIGITGGYSRFTLKNNTLSDTHRSVVEIEYGADHLIEGNDISRGGQEGLGVFDDGLNFIIRRNKIHHNNTEEYFVSDHGGAGKTTKQRGAIFEYNEVYENDGVALWCDIDCNGVIYRYNRVHDNANTGIFYEISTGGKIYGNVIWNNDSMGIYISSSANTEVYDNVLAWNRDGISVSSQQRLEYQHVNNFVHDNTIIGECQSRCAFGLEWWQDWAGSILYQPSSNNRGANNTYWYNTSEDGRTRYVWNGQHSSLASFNATPGEEAGRYLSDAEKDQILLANCIPLTPGGPIPCNPSTTPTATPTIGASPTPGGPTPTPPPTGRRPYPDGSPPKQIPGTIQAEDYDIGGEGVSYHDTDATNQGGAYRSDGVDIKTSTDIANP